MWCNRKNRLEKQRQSRYDGGPASTQHPHAAGALLVRLSDFHRPLSAHQPSQQSDLSARSSSSAASIMKQVNANKTKCFSFCFGGKQESQKAAFSCLLHQRAWTFKQKRSYSPSPPSVEDQRIAIQLKTKHFSN